VASAAVIILAFDILLVLGCADKIYFFLLNT